MQPWWCPCIDLDNSQKVGVLYHVVSTHWKLRWISAVKDSTEPSANAGGSVLDEESKGVEVMVVDRRVTLLTFMQDVCHTCNYCCFFVVFCTFMGVQTVDRWGMTCNKNSQPDMNQGWCGSGLVLNLYATRCCFFFVLKKKLLSFTIPQLLRADFCSMKGFQNMLVLNTVQGFSETSNISVLAFVGFVDNKKHLK